MYTITTTAQQNCSANITIGRNRVKTYTQDVDCVYLKDGQKFEIELFNPNTYKVLAKIKMNGQHISSSGIVLNPGQRVYLERYLDSNNAFLFSTYEIDGTTEALRAISENGNFEVEFYSEYIPLNSNWNSNYWNGSVQPIPFYGGTTNPYTVYCSTTNTIGGNASTFTTTINERVKGSLETGRVEKGESTNQSFTTDNGSYNSFAMNTVSIKMLPASLKPIEAKEIRNYCTGCGTRAKKASWKFCPSCGEKI
jgi:hypothetical protein